MRLRVRVSTCKSCYQTTCLHQQAQPGPDWTSQAFPAPQAAVRPDAKCTTERSCFLASSSRETGCWPPPRTPGSPPGPSSELQAHSVLMRRRLQSQQGVRKEAKVASNRRGPGRAGPASLPWRPRPEAGSGPMSGHSLCGQAASHRGVTRGLRAAPETVKTKRRRTAGGYPASHDPARRPRGVRLHRSRCQRLASKTGLGGAPACGGRPFRA